MALLRLQYAEFSPPLEGNQLVLSVAETQIPVRIHPVPRIED